MRRLAAGVLLGTAVLLGGTAAPAAADDPSASPSPGAAEDAVESEAGTTFRSATVLETGRAARAVASSGDYLYWVFPAGAGSAPQVKAAVDLPEPATRTGSTTWQLTVYDGLRRQQPCASGTHTRTAGQDTARLELACTLRPVQPWADTWSDAPLPGAYFVRLTAARLPEKDRGLPVRTEIEVDAASASGAARGGGSLPSPLLPALGAGGAQPAGSADADTDADAAEGDEGADDGVRTLELAEPDGGWTGPLWSDRWLWTAGGGVLGALAAVGGYLWVRRPLG